MEQEGNQLWCLLKVGSEEGYAGVMSYDRDPGHMGQMVCSVQLDGLVDR